MADAVARRDLRARTRHDLLAFIDKDDAVAIGREAFDGALDPFGAKIIELEFFLIGLVVPFQFRAADPRVLEGWCITGADQAIAMIGVQMGDEDQIDIIGVDAGGF